MRLRLALLSALVLTGAALADVVPPIEPIYGVEVGRQTITLRLASNGCTQKSDLTAAVAKSAVRPMLLIARKHPDACRSATAGRAIVVYSFKELGLDPDQPFTLANPLAADPSP